MTAIKSDGGIQQRRDVGLGRLFVLLAREFTRRALARLAAAGFDDINLSHLLILAHIPTEGLRASDVAERAGLTKQAVSKTLSELKQRGYIVTKSDPSDRRAQVITYTDRGLALFEIGVDIADGVEAEMATFLPNGRLESIKADLVKLREATGA